VTTETQLQQMQRALVDVVLDAREVLDTEAYVVFIDWLCAVVAREAAQLIGWEAQS
jgi:hypothetical protein